MDPSGLLSRLSSQSAALSQCGRGSASAARMEARSRAPRRRLCPPGIVLLTLASLLSCLLTSGQAKVYSRCELARLLQDVGLDGFRGYSLANCEDPTSLDRLRLPLPLPPYPSSSVALMAFRASVPLCKISILLEFPLWLSG